MTKPMFFDLFGTLTWKKNEEKNSVEFQVCSYRDINNNDMYVNSWSGLSFLAF